MKKNIQNICDDVVTRYEPDKNVLGIMLFGSVARNKFDQYSDIDIYILLNKKGKLSRCNFIKDKIRVDIIFNTVQEVQDYLTEDKNNLRRITSHMLAHGKILFQRKGSLKRFRIIARNNLSLKIKYTKGEILMHKYSIDDFWGEVRRDIKNNDFLAFGIDSNLLISNIIELFLKLNGEFLRQPNEMMEILKKLDSKFANQVENFYRISDMRNKERILAVLVKYIYTKSKGPLPNRWSLRN